MNIADYPFLFIAADEAAIRKQRLYLSLILTEYALLLGAAVINLPVWTTASTNIPPAGSKVLILYEWSALIFVALLVVLLCRSLLKPEQDWFRCRALAEGLKTLAWRYMMHAAPFEARDGAGASAEAAFRDKLHEVLSENVAVAALTYHDEATGDYVTPEIRRVRVGLFEERAAYYREERIQRQREWYAGKAAWNRRASTFWVVASACAYVTAAVMVFFRANISNPPIEPVIVLASSLVGWMQVRKFNELSASYTITAHEIGLLKAKMDFVHSDQELAAFVGEAELSFSREHTLWFGKSLT